MKHPPGALGIRNRLTQIVKVDKSTGQKLVNICSVGVRDLRSEVAKDR